MRIQNASNNEEGSRNRTEPTTCRTIVHQTQSNDPGPIHSIQYQVNNRRSESADTNRWSIALIPLVKAIAEQIHRGLPSHIEKEDLESVGFLGLLDAIGKFDPNKQKSLRNYANFRVRGAILDWLRTMDTTSRGLRRTSKNIERVRRDLSARLQCNPNGQEMADALGITLAEWNRKVSQVNSGRVFWLGDLVSFKGDDRCPVELDSLPANNDGHQFEESYNREKKQILNTVLGQFPERDRQVIEMYHFQGLRMRDIGMHLGIHESRVSQIHSSALKRLIRRVRTLLSKSAPITLANPCEAT